MINIKTNLLKNLTATFVIVFTVGVGSAWAEEIKFKPIDIGTEFIKKVNDIFLYKKNFKLPKCTNSNVLNWDGCYGYDKTTNEEYFGEFKNGKRSGYGELLSIEEDFYYEGNFYDGKKEGYGTYIYSADLLSSITNIRYQKKNRNKIYSFFELKNKFHKNILNKDSYYIIYYGNFKLDKKNENGILLSKDGDKFEGNFREKEIKGVLKKNSGELYEGIFEEGYLFGFDFKINGEGKWFGKEEVNYTEMKDGLILKNTHTESYYGNFENGHRKGIGKLTDKKGNVYEGEFDFDMMNGFGLLSNIDGSNYLGEFKFNLFNGKGIYTHKDKSVTEGIWDSGLLIEQKKINLNSLKEQFKNIYSKQPTTNNDNLITKKINLQVTNSQANTEGDFVINIQTGTDTASLKINGEEFGGRADGNYTIKKIARAGQETKFTIVAKDTNGNSDSKTISVTRQVAASSQVKYAELNPALVKTQPNKDTVAIIIGIADYKNLPRADFANDDARAFYDYAIRGLGVKVENIKLLVDEDAGQGEILKTFKTWLPSRVTSTTDVYVYYSGHGLPSADGQTLYLLPQLADRDLIEDTAVAQNRINAAIQATKPKSVTIFLDSCYSGVARTGQTLLASARPISLKANTQTFPSEFTVFTASKAEQISSSSNELKHGIFSYYLMRGMEGEADTNKDGKITTGEMQGYLVENVAKQASLANRVQQPQLAGDANRILVGR
jgi:hypothetical protein